MFLRSLILLSFFGHTAVAQDAQSADFQRHVQGEIMGQLNFLKDTAAFPEEMRAEEQELRAQAIAELFFDRRIRSFHARDVVFETSEQIVNEMEAFLSKGATPERREVVRALEQAMLNVSAKVQQSKEFQDSQAQMRNRSFLGFVVSPGAVLSAYAIGDFLILVGRGLDFVQYVLPRELWNGGKQVVYWSQLQWALLRDKAEKADSCRAKIRHLKELRQGRQRRFVRDAQRAVGRWGNRVRPSRLITYSALGGLISWGLYHRPIPHLSELSFEDQHDWDAQEDALKEILVPFFARH